MIEIHGVGKTFGRGRKSTRALERVDLEIAGHVRLAGPEWRRQDDLIRILAGIVNPSAGSVRVADQDLSNEAGRRAAKSVLGYLPQELGMYLELTAEQFVDYMAILKGMDDAKQRAVRVAEVLAMVASRTPAQQDQGFSGA